MIHRTILFLTLCGFFTVGCGKQEPPKVVVDKAGEKGGPQQPEVPQPPKIQETNLWPHGIPGVMNLPEDAKIARIQEILSITLGKEQSFNISLMTPTFDQVKADLQKPKGAKLHLDEANVAIVEIPAGKESRFQLAVQAMLGTKRYLVRGDPSGEKTLEAAQALREYAVSLRQTDAIVQASNREKSSIELLRQFGIAVADVNDYEKTAIIELKQPFQGGELSEWSSISGLTTVEVRGAAIDPRFLEQLCAKPGIAHLILKQPQLPDALLVPVAKMTSLVGLRLDSVAITDNGLASLSSLKKLRTLELGLGNYQPAINGTGFEKWLDTTPLTLLNLGRLPITDEGFRNVGKFTALKQLNLDQTLITNQGLTALRDLTALKQLSLNGTRINDVGLARLTGLSDLEVLRLDHTAIAGNTLHLLRDKCKKLKAIHLNHTFVSDTSIEKLKGLPIEVLMLGHSQITDASLPHIAAMKAINTLNLAGTSITDAALPHLAGLTKVQHLDLGSTAIVGAALDQLKPLTELRHLSLSNTLVADAGFMKLPVLPNLLHLDVSSTRITDAVFPHLAKYERLNSLYIRDARVTSNAVKAWETAAVGRSVLSTARNPEPDLKSITPPTPIAELKPADPEAVFKKYDRKPMVDQDSPEKPVIAVDFSDTALTDLELGSLRSLKSIRRLKLASCENITDAGLPYLGLLTTLEELDLSGTKIAGDGLVHLKPLTKLKKLLLPFTPMTSKQASAIGELKALEESVFRLTGSEAERSRILANLANYKTYTIETEGNCEVAANLKTMTGLETLTLAGDIPNHALIHLKELKHLKQVKLRSPYLSDAGLAHLAGLTGIERLTLQQCRITDAGLVHLKELKKLIVLDLDGRFLTDLSVSHLRELDSLAKLTMPNAPITDRALQVFAGMKDLDTIVIPGSRITDGGLSALKALEELRVVDFSGTAVTGRGFAEWKELKVVRVSLAESKANDEGTKGITLLRNLQSLDLRRTAVTDKGIATFQKHPVLADLNLSDNPEITDAVIAYLKTLPQLRYVNLNGSAVTQKGLDELKQAKPMVSIAKQE